VYNNKYNFEQVCELINKHVKQGNNLLFIDNKLLIAGNKNSENKFIKIIDATLNSGVRTIILGIKQIKEKAKEASYINTKNITEFWLQTLITNNISPFVEKINIYTLCSENEENGFIVIDLSEVVKKPYMANDGRYYFLLKNKPEIMNENQVKEIYLQSSKPDLEFVGILNTNGIPTFDNGNLISVIFYPKFLIRNSGLAIENNFKFEIWIPSEIHDLTFTALQNYFNRTEEKYSVFTVTNRQPLFQNEMFNIAESKLVVNHNNIKSFEELNVKIKIYYSFGLKEFSYKLTETFKLDNKYLNRQCFVTNNNLK